MTPVPAISPHIAVGVAAGVATITMVNPAHRNALTSSMLRQLTSSVRELAQDGAVSVLVLTGEGDFCAGMDLSEWPRADQDERYGEEFTAAEEVLAAFPKPTIAAIDGYCLGGGAQLAIACDLRVAAEGSRIAITPAKIGLVYPASSVDRLVRAVGPAVARYLLFTAEFVDAATGLRMGLVSEVVMAGELTSRTRRLADTVATRSPISLLAAKQMIDAAACGGVGPGLAEYWATAPNIDLAEGVAAFRDRRSPRFTTRS
ncbi:enoyl-CoA hydratase-related protein [Streptosporangium soli]|nr:enoyl-CoA hydratase-related protein [Streptosporangium sp. KLBMP 9127]